MSNFLILNLVKRKVTARLPKVKNEWKYRTIRPYAVLMCRGTTIAVPLLNIICGVNPNSSPNLRAFLCFHNTQET